MSIVIAMAMPLPWPLPCHCHGHDIVVKFKNFDTVVAETNNLMVIRRVKTSLNHAAIFYNFLVFSLTLPLLLLCQI